MQSNSHLAYLTFYILIFKTFQIISDKKNVMTVFKNEKVYFEK